MSEQAFEFEAKGYNGSRVCWNENDFWVEGKHEDGTWHRYISFTPRCLSYGIRALISRDAQRKKCWQELMAWAREEADNSEDAALHRANVKILDALQAEWERGGV